MIEQYRSPVTSLYDNIIASLSNSSPQMTNRLAQLLSDNKINPRIVINAEYNAVKTPEANPETREILLQEAHISYVWCIAYLILSIIIINDEKARLGYTVVNIGQSEERDELNQLLAWALSLSENYSEWPNGIVKPTDVTVHRVLQANQITGDVMRYLMYHEIAHLANGHESYHDIIKKIKKDGYVPTETERLSLIELEIEADNYALDCCLLTENNENEKYLKIQGAVVAHLSNFYLLKDTDTRGTRHPDIDVRLYNLMNKVKLDGEPHSTYIVHTVNVGLQLYLHIMGVPYMNENGYQEFEDLTKALFELIDIEKQKHRIRKGN